jgi:hypothetical protein
MENHRLKIFIILDFILYLTNQNLFMLKDNSQRAKNIIILFWVLFGITIISIVSTFMEYSLLKRIIEGNFTLEEADANDTRQRLIGIVEIIIHILVIVYFIMWFRRAYYNLHALGCYVRYSEGWAAGGWFVPFLNLVRPFEIMKDIWNRTQERAQLGMENTRVESSAIVGVWWFLWLATNIASNIIFRLRLTGDPDAGELMSLDKAAMIIDAFSLVNIVIIVIIIKKIRGFEDRLQDVIVVENIAAEDKDPSLVS